MDNRYEFLGYPENFDRHPLADIILKYIKRGPILDVGCGNGNLLSLIKDKFEVEGFDISEVAVNLARKRGLNIKLAGIENFSTNKKFKTILMIGILVLYKNPKEVLEKVSEWLDDNGVIMLTTPNAISLKNLFGLFKRKNQCHLYYPGFFEFRNFLKKNNFKILKCIGVGRLEKFPILSSVNFYIIKPE